MGVGVLLNKSVVVLLYHIDNAADICVSS